MTNPNLDVARFRANLESEVILLTQELSGITKTENEKPALEFREEVADMLEDQEERGAETESLHARLKAVQMALTKMADGTYGKCEVGGEEIEADRLEANPAARTCKAHLDQEPKLD